MGRAIRVNTLVEETTKAAAMFHAAATGSGMLHRKTSVNRLAASPAA